MKKEIPSNFSFPKYRGHVFIDNFYKRYIYIFKICHKLHTCWQLMMTYFHLCTTCLFPVLIYWKIQFQTTIFYRASSVNIGCKLLRLFKKCTFDNDFRIFRLNYIPINCHEIDNFAHRLFWLHFPVHRWLIST